MNKGTNMQIGNWIEDNTKEIERLYAEFRKQYVK